MSKAIYDELIEKTAIKKQVLINAEQAYKWLCEELKKQYDDLVEKTGNSNNLNLKENGAYETEIHFGDEVLIFSLHTDVFNFDDTHFTHKTEYVKDDMNRSYVGIIKVYNFLADSFAYNRNNDLGYLIARIFINIDNHFFVEGKRQLGFLYNDFENAVLTQSLMADVIESCMLYAIQFDLLVPPFDAVKEITLYQKIEQHGMAAIKTGKRLGFKFQADSDNIES